MSRKLELRWSQPFVVKDVAGFYKKLLPIIVQVEEGYNGITDEETYSRDDMFIITEAREQKRIAALALRKRDNQSCVHISLPVISKARFHVVRKDGSMNECAETLLEIDKSVGLEEDMRLLPDVKNPVEFNQYIGDGKPGKSIKFGELTVTNVFTQDYLVGFGLPELQTPHEQTDIFPVHMDLKLKVAESLDGGTKQDFKLFMKHTRKKTSQFTHSFFIHGTTEIMLYSEEMGDEDPYEYASPADYIRFSQVQRQSSVPSRPEGITTELEHSRPEVVTTERNPSYIGAEGVKPKVAKRPRAPDPISDEEELNETVSKLQLSQTCTKTSESATVSSPHQASAGGNARKEKPKTAPRPATKPKKSDILARAEAPERSLSTLSQTQSVLQSTSTGTEKRLVMPVQPTTRLSTDGDMSQVPKSPKPTGFVAPMVHAGSDETETATPTEHSQSTNRSLDAQESKDRRESQECIYKSFAEIPKDISPLSTREIAACLTRMNMDKYINTFEEYQIDGTLLLALTEEDLANDFGMSKTEVKKIWLFAHKQWRPNTK